MLARRERAEALGGVRAVGAADRSRRGVRGIRREAGPADRAELGLAREHRGELGRTREHGDDAGEAGVRNAHAGQVVADRLRAVEAPVGPERAADVIGDEADGADRRVAEAPRRYVEQRYCQHVSGLGALDVHRPRERVHRANLPVARPRVVVGALRVEVEVAGVAHAEDDGLSRLRAGRHRDRRVQPVEALRVLAAVAPLAADHDDLLLRRGRRSRGRGQGEQDRGDHTKWSGADRHAPIVGLGQRRVNHGAVGRRRGAARRDATRSPTRSAGPGRSPPTTSFERRNTSFTPHRQSHLRRGGVARDHLDSPGAAVQDAVCGRRGGAM